MTNNVEQLMRLVPFIIGQDNVQTIVYRAIRPEMPDLRQLARQPEIRRLYEELQGKEDECQ